MAQSGKYLRRYGPADGYYGRGYCHWCPACERMHAFAVEEPFRNGARWTFDGNIEKPTFSPSMSIVAGPDPEDGYTERCHYFLNAGMIQFLADCTHAMAGTSITLPELPEHLKDDGKP